MGHAQILAGGQQVLDALRYQRAERDLEGIAADVDIVAQAGAGMQVDAVTADTDAVIKLLGGIEAFALLDADMFFQHGELGEDAAGFAHIDILRHAVACADDIRSQPQAWITVALSVRSGALRSASNTERKNSTACIRAAQPA